MIYVKPAEYIEAVQITEDMYYLRADIPVWAKEKFVPLNGILRVLGTDGVPYRIQPGWYMVVKVQGFHARPIPGTVECMTPCAWNLSGYQLYSNQPAGQS